jgi:MFS family permease
MSGGGDGLFRGAAGRALALLTLVNLFNYLDRYVVSALAESLRRSDLALSDTQLGFVATGFILVYTLASPLFGWLGDHRRRPPVIALGVGLWSLATAAGGAARGFVSLFTARAAVGVGEAAYGTIAPAMLADAFPAERRGRVFAVFFAAIPIGSAAGYIVGGLLDARFGWRVAFLAAGLPGILLAFAVSRLADPPRGGARAVEVEGSPTGGGVLAVWRELASNGAYVRTVAGYAAYTFALGGLAFWMPAFLERVRGLSKSEATIGFGIVVVATGFAGTFAGGWAADLLRRKTVRADLWVSGVTTLAAAPAAAVALFARDRALFFPAIVVAELLLFASTGPVNAAIVEVVRPGQRATAVALSILAIHLLGDVPSPPLIGALSDRIGLERAVIVVPAAILVSGVVWLLGVFRGPWPAGAEVGS